MKYYGHGEVNLTEGLEKLLQETRKIRAFEPKKYLEDKKELFLDYIEKYGITHTVVALSGGVDSSLVYAMLNYFKAESTQLKDVVGICLPAYENSGVTNQTELVKKVEKLMNQFGYDYKEYNMTPVVSAIDTQFKENHSDLWTKDDWALGQVVSYARTPVYYYITSLLSAKGFRSVVVGTTNKSEGAYLGYFGKASDGLVDIQLISDLFKNEVYELAVYLNVPIEILQATPTGDMYDNRSDEEVFGTSYEFVEIYTYFLENIKGDFKKEKEFYMKINDSLDTFLKNKDTLEDLHSYNGHKYLGHSPAVHMDIILGTENIQNGWKYYNHKLPPKSFINPHEISKEVISILKNNTAKLLSEPKVNLKDSKIVNAENLLSKKEIELINFELSQKNWIPVGINGILKDYNEGDEIGSYRLSIYNKELAEVLSMRLQHLFENLNLKLDEYSLTDWDNHKDWEFVGINPLMRFIKYNKDGALVPHYDGSYIESDDVRTLRSLVIYFEYSEDATGGRTRFIKDESEELPRNERNLSDWSEKLLDEDELIYKIYGGTVGEGLIFNHEILHDSEALHSGNKVILRTDLVYKKKFNA